MVITHQRTGIRTSALELELARKALELAIHALLLANQPTGISTSTLKLELVH
jgi:hypothetical protein